MAGNNDNVVRPVFGTKKVSQPLGQTAKPSIATDTDDDEDEVVTLTGEILERAQLDLIYILSNHDYVSRIRDMIADIGDHIFRLTDFKPNDHNIKLRRQGLRLMSFQDLCAQVENSHQGQWTSQPSYFGALTLEHYYRVKYALSLLPKE